MAMSQVCAQVGKSAQGSAAGSALGRFSRILSEVQGAQTGLTSSWECTSGLGPTARHGHVHNHAETTSSRAAQAGAVAQSWTGAGAWLGHSPVVPCVCG